MRRGRGLVVSLVLLLASAAAARARIEPAAGGFDPALFSALRWRSIGPANTGGRVDDFALRRVAGRPDPTYVATASGGGFQTSQQGTSGAPGLDRRDAMLADGA